MSNPLPTFIAWLKDTPHIGPVVGPIHTVPATISIEIARRNGTAIPSERGTFIGWAEISKQDPAALTIAGTDGTASISFQLGWSDNNLQITKLNIEDGVHSDQPVAAPIGPSWTLLSPTVLRVPFSVFYPIVGEIIYPSFPDDYATLEIQTGILVLSPPEVL